MYVFSAGRALGDQPRVTVAQVTESAAAIDGQRLGITRKMLYDILDGTSAVTASMALKLEACVGSTAEFWLRLQAQHDLWKARRMAASATNAKKPARRAQTRTARKSAA